MKKIILILVFALNFLYAEPDFYFIDKPKPTRAINENKNSYTIDQFKIEWGNLIPENDTWKDLDSNGYPDYIDIVANALTYSLDTFLNAGFEFDSNLKDIPIIIANTNASYDGYNQTLPSERYGGAYYYSDNSFYFIINSIMPTILGQDSQQKNIEVTIAHELMHVLQYFLINKYNFYHSVNDTWLYEASAVFSEELCYPEHNYHTRYIKELYENLSEGIFSNIGYGPYRGVYFLQYLEQKYSDFSLYDLWLNYMSRKDGVGVLSDFAISKDTNLETLLKEFYLSIYRVDEFYPNNANIYKNYISTEALKDEFSILSGGCIKSEKEINFNEDSDYWFGSEVDTKFQFKANECNLFLGNKELNSSRDLKKKNFVSINLTKGWNLISIPVNKEVKDELFQYERVLSYDEIWSEIPNFLEPKKGYWIYSNIDKKIYFSGDAYDIDTSTINYSWQLLGAGVDITLNGFEIWTYRDKEWKKGVSSVNRGEGFWIRK